MAIEWLLITDGIDNKRSEEEKDYKKAEVASLGETLFDCNLEVAVSESLKETAETTWRATRFVII